MNDIYKQAALEAMNASIAANRKLTKESHNEAASKHLAAKTAAFGAGLEAPVNEHDQIADAHITAGISCANSEKAKVVLGKELQASAEQKDKQKLVLDAANKRMTGKKELQAGIKDSGFSYQDFQDELRQAIQAIPLLTTCPADNKSFCGGPWVADVIIPAHEDGETWEAIVQGADGKLYCVSFLIDSDTGVSLASEPKQVERETDYDYVFKPEQVAASNASSKQAKQNESQENKEEQGGKATAPNDNSDDEVECPNCKKSFKRTQEITGGDNSNQLTCPYCTKPFKREMEASNAAKTLELQASREKAMAMKKYNGAAIEAANASDAVKTMHSKAAALHTIAREHANMNELSAEAMMHNNKAREHVEACEACNSALPSRMPAKVTAAHEATVKALEAGGPGSGRHSETTGTADAQSERANKKSSEAREATSAALKSKNSDDHITAASEHDSAAAAHKDAVMKQLGAGNPTSAQSHGTDVIHHEYMAANHRQQAEWLDKKK